MDMDKFMLFEFLNVLKKKQYLINIWIRPFSDLSYACLTDQVFAGCKRFVCNIYD